MSEDTTTPDVDEAPEVVETDLTDQDGSETEVEAVEGEDIVDDQAEDEADELEEIEWEGKKFRAPPEVKAAMLREADYTRKTQEVAAIRKSVETRNTELEQRAEVVEALREDYGKYHALKSQVSTLRESIRSPGWPAWAQENPVEAQQVWLQYQQSAEELVVAETELSEKETVRLKEQATARDARLATAREEAEAVLARDIKGWGAQKAQEIIRHGIENYGLRPEEVPEFLDHRVWKILNDNMTLKSELAKVRKTAVVKRQQNTQPAQQIQARSAPPRRLSDETGTEAWMRQRNADAAKKRA